VAPISQGPCSPAEPSWKLPASRKIPEDTP
jgi:hypothetical protein